MHAAIARTIDRYRQVRPADRYYVSAKLRTDPLVAELVASTYPLGDVVDAGCGRGQFGLLLYELGRLTSLRGYDWDANKIETAQAAGIGAAEYEVADLRAAPTHVADTILMFDVLQYLSLEEQRKLLGRLISTLRPGGRILLRSVDRSRGWQAGLSQWLERLGRQIGFNRSYTLEFRASEALRADLIALGLKVEGTTRGHSSLLDNRLLIAQH